MPPKIRVLLAEDHHLVRTAFATLLSKETDIEVVGEIEDSTGLLDTCRMLKPDVLVLDAHMPGGKVISAAHEIQEQCPSVRVLVLSAYDRREYVVGLVRAGVAGYILKHDSPEMLIHAVRAVANGEEWLSPRVADILMKSLRSVVEESSRNLTRRELEVLGLMAKGYKNDEIARELVITQQTVKNHIRSIFGKLEVDSRVDAVLYAIDRDINTDLE